MLKAALAPCGIHLDVRHLYLEFAAHLSTRAQAVVNQLNEPEVLYCRALYPERFRSRRQAVYAHVERRGVAAREFQNALDEIDAFNRHLASDPALLTYEVVGFSVSYHQTAPSLLAAQIVKTGAPGTRIVFGGSGVARELGERLVSAFDQVDAVLSGFSDESLPAYLEHVRGERPIGDVPGLIYRSDDGKVQRNAEPAPVSMNNLEVPDYSDYFSSVTMFPTDERSGWPAADVYLENSRGCYWRKCSFCSAACRPGKYREKSPERLVHEMREINARHGATRFRLVGETYSPRRTRRLARLLSAEEHDFDVMLYARCDLNSDDYDDLYRAGIRRMMLGIEQFSTSLLAKMVKGVSGIDNVEALMSCERAGMEVRYYLFVDYPTMTMTEADETLDAIEYLSHLQPPISGQLFELQYASPVFERTREWGIDAVLEPEWFSLLYPREIRQAYRPFRFEYFSKSPVDRAEELALRIRHWQEDYSSRTAPALTADPAGRCVQVRDGRRGEREFELRGIERDVLLASVNRTDISNIAGELDASERDVQDAVMRLQRKRLVFREGGELIALPLFH